MKNFPTENLTELTPDELTTVQGGGLLTNLIVTATSLVANLPRTTGTVNTTVKGLVDFLI